MAQELLILSLGPVQEFIAAGRRCQDLWFGSRLLSDLSHAVAQKVESLAGGQALIFPGDLKDEKASVANVIVALVPEGRSKAIAVAARGAMKDELESVTKASLDRIAPRDLRFVKREVAEKQVGELMEFQWAAAPCTTLNYASRRRELMEILAARKNTRTWDPVGWNPGIGIPKSSIDGLRESVLSEELFEKGNLAARRSLFVKGAERLCGVALMKRLGFETNAGGRYRPAFHSTSHMAAGPALVRIARDAKKRPGAVSAYIKSLEKAGLELGLLTIRPGDVPSYDAVRPEAIFGSSETVEVSRVFAPADGGSDGVVLFPERLADLFENESGLAPEELAGGVAAGRSALDGFLRGVGFPKPEEGPCPYYALLAADGDHMGRAIDMLDSRPKESLTADLPEALDGSDTVEEHRRLSQEVEKFATSCRELVEKHGGSAIYAGGDDVLALLPLHTVLACAAALRGRFEEAARKGCPYLPESDRPTLSVGVAICHQLDGLTEARALALHAEGLAKVERNSLAIVVSKRSGADVEVAALWKDDLPKRIITWCALLRHGTIPNSAAFDIEAALRPFSVPGLGGSVVAEPPSALVASLILGVLKRKRTGEGTALAAETVEKIDKLLRLETATEGAARKRALALSAEIQIARLFLVAYEEAWGEPVTS